jgi:ATP-binding cassette subfamily F protein 3
VLVGPNGAGKSTLLKIMGAVVPIQGGTLTVGHNISVGYFAQHRSDMLDVQRTVLEEAMKGVRVSELQARTLLGAFLFRGDDAFKKVSVLSGGEKSRLALAKLLLNPPNLLLLDEPTTHLDMTSIDALIGALKQYEGTVLFVSHDVHFIRAISSTVLHIHAGKLTPYAGNYEYYLEKSGAASERAGLVANLHNARPVEKPTVIVEEKKGLKEIREERRRATDSQKSGNRERREQEKRVAQLEKEIQALEMQQAGLVDVLEDPATYADAGKAIEINRQLTAVSDSIARATADWEAASALLE